MQRKFDIYVGMPRSGKSTFSTRIIKPYPQNLIIIKHTSNVNDDTHAFLTEKTMSNWRQGVPPNGFVKCKMAVKNKKELLVFLAWAADHYRNGMLMIDDASILVRDRMPEILEEIVAMRAHYGLDVTLIYHGFTGCPIDQFRYGNNFFIFCTTDEPEYKKGKLPQFGRVIEAAQRAKVRYNSYGEKDPRRYIPERVDITSM